VLALVLAVAGHVAWRRSQRGREPRAPRRGPAAHESGD
jgi:hypothetical protein